MVPLPSLKTAVRVVLVPRVIELLAGAKLEIVGGCGVHAAADRHKTAIKAIGVLGLIFPSWIECRSELLGGRGNKAELFAHAHAFPLIWVVLSPIL
jgi:hypothetical protein